VSELLQKRVGASLGGYVKMENASGRLEKNNFSVILNDSRLVIQRYNANLMTKRTANVPNFTEWTPYPVWAYETSSTGKCGNRFDELRCFEITLGKLILNEFLITVVEESDGDRYWFELLDSPDKTQKDSTAKIIYRTELLSEDTRNDENSINKYKWHYEKDEKCVTKRLGILTLCATRTNSVADKEKAKLPTVDMDIDTDATVLKAKLDKAKAQ
jgi:hypothetical protein